MTANGTPEAPRPPDARERRYWRMVAAVWIPLAALYAAAVRQQAGGDFAVYAFVAPQFLPALLAALALESFGPKPPRLFTRWLLVFAVLGGVLSILFFLPIVLTSDAVSPAARERLLRGLVSDWIIALVVCGVIARLLAARSVKPSGGRSR